MDPDLSEYLGDCADHLLETVLRGGVHDGREIRFLLRFGASLKRSKRIRAVHECEGMHIPMFLICSITSSCNLSCKGCYARANGICGDVHRTEMLPEDWDSIFEQASSLGIPFIILAGGEPLLRQDIVGIAASHRDMVFPLFTNGSLLESNMDLIDRNRNIIPILSLEGGKGSTDGRRGTGAYDRTMSTMGELGRRGLFFGASVTVTTENSEEVLDDGFVDSLESSGCGILFLIEFVPSDRNLISLAPDSTLRARNLERVEELRRDHRIVIMSFPGDEAKLGGCLGAGRGFFHINPFGDAEACPASPYSDVNVRDGGLESAIMSDLFGRIRSCELLSEDHDGGCALLEHEAEVIEMIREN